MFSLVTVKRIRIISVHTEIAKKKRTKGKNTREDGKKQYGHEEEREGRRKKIVWKKERKNPVWKPREPRKKKRLPPRKVSALWKMQ